MANPLLPAGRTTPIAAYIGVRRLPPFNLVLKVSAVDASNRTRQPNALQGQGISSALLGGQNGGAGATTLKAVGGF
jgi:hypothetical protein